MSSKFMHSWVLHDDGCDFIILLLPTPACWDATQESRKSHAVVNFLHQVRVLAAAAAAVGLCLGGTFRARPNKANRDIIKSNFFSSYATLPFFTCRFFTTSNAACWDQINGSREWRKVFAGEILFCCCYCWHWKHSSLSTRWMETALE